MTTNIDRYWKQYLDSLPEGAPHPSTYAEPFSFGSDADSASKISRLVIMGIKTATGSLKWTYEAAEQPEPQIGDFSVVINGADDPVCIIETTEVKIIPFDEVGEDYAVDGGEGDRMLDHWRTIYWSHILAECARIGKDPSHEAPLVMERFRAVYVEPLADNPES
jgi:uncharacterized protein YhfF